MSNNSWIGSSTEAKYSTALLSLLVQNLSWSSMSKSLRKPVNNRSKSTDYLTFLFIADPVVVVDVLELASGRQQKQDHRLYCYLVYCRPCHGHRCLRARERPLTEARAHTVLLSCLLQTLSWSSMSKSSRTAVNRSKSIDHQLEEEREKKEKEVLLLVLGKLHVSLKAIVWSKVKVVFRWNYGSGV